MTTAAYDRRNRTIVADTQNTDKSGAIYRVNKIERLKDGSYFLGSGHCLTIGLTRRWAEKQFAETDRPEYGPIFEDADEFGFSCLWISKDGSKVVLIDDEMEPTELMDDYVAVGSGASYVIGAMDAGADVIKAVGIACARDGSTSAPVNVQVIA